MPRGKANADHASDPRTNKMEAVRQAMNGLGNDALPQAIHQYILDNFGFDMNINMISSYKSNLRKKAGVSGRRRKRGRPRKTDAAPTAAPAAAVAHDSVPWKDIRTIKDIAARLGKKGVRELLELMD